MYKTHQPEGVSIQMKHNKTDLAQPETGKAGFLTESFEALFVEHWPQVYRVVLRLVGDPAEAEDLALETFYRLHTHHHNFDADFNTGGWLHRVAINLGLHSLRSFKRRERYELAAGQRAIKEAPENRPAEIMAAEEDKQAARAILAGMPERQARILVMRYSGASYKEIATALSVSTASIGPILLRAEKEFEKRYRALNREEI